MTDAVLDRFSSATREWFASNFAAPTPAQAGAWEAISSARHTLVVAPTGSGKTLSAFLWALDRLATEPAPDPERRCRVLYISPLKALAVDVERNLRSPLVGIGHAADRLGLARPEITVAVRSGDTPADQRRRLAKQPPDILITTPESLFLLLTSAARETLRGVETVIIDEVHAVAGTKRGAHLALSLERLDALLERPAQRIGLSATVRPVEEVARFLAGGRDVAVVAPPSEKKWNLEVVVPVPDLGAIGEMTGDLSGPAAGEPERTSIFASLRSANPSSPSAEPGQARLGTQASSIWPHVEEKIVDQIAAHSSTLVFVNSRRLAERLTARLNEIWIERLEAAGSDTEIPGQARDDVSESRDDGHPNVIPANAGISGPRAPAHVLAQSGVAQGVPPVLARAHHGSVSREQRQLIEEDLKAGRLPAVVATSSLELGIDMGAVDLVIQVEAPPSVASGLQRVGRAGHQVGAVSHGVLFPKFRGDLVQTAVAVERMRTGQIEALTVLANPLDVLAQQIVAMVAMDTLTVPELETLLRRSAPFSGLTRGVLESVLDMLAGRYPSDDFAELRPRLVWDRTTGELTGRRGAQRLAVTSGGTIPDRGLYGVFLATDSSSADAGTARTGRRVGELDEEMVYESRVGDVIALGTSSWQIVEITHDQVRVQPAPGMAARLPFWKGDSLGRPAEFGAGIGAFIREISGMKPAAARVRVQALGLDEWATDNLLSYLDEQRQATGALPHDRQIVIERCRDEIGDWRVIVHSPYGARVHAPWSLAVASRLRERYGVDVQAMHADDGMVFRLPDTDWADTVSLPAPVDAPGTRGGATKALAGSGTDLVDELSELIFLDPDEIPSLINEQVGGSALFASRFRECAGRALLLPKRRPDQRQALWQQRLRAAQLLEVASNYPSFPIVLEAVRECVNDVFDVPALVEVLRGVRSRQISTLAVETPRPSPFASSLLFGYVAQYLYEGDSPLAERRAAALSLDPTLLAELLGTTEGLSLADLLDPEALTRTERELQHLDASRWAADADQLTDLLRTLGPLTTAELAARTSGGADPVTTWLADLVAARRVLPLPGDRWAVIEDAGRVRDALGVALPPGVPAALAEPVPDPLGDLLARYARTHTVFSAADAAAWLGIGVAVVRDHLRRLVAARRIVEGDLRPPGWLPPGPPPTGEAAAAEGTTAAEGAVSAQAASAVAGAQFCDARVLRLLRRRSLAALREAVEPVTAADFARFVPSWQGVGQLRGTEGVLRAIEQLAGVAVPASALESLILPARVVDYRPAMLDELTAAGEVVWQGRGALAGTDGWLALAPAEIAGLTLVVPASGTAPLTPASTRTDLVGELTVPDPVIPGSTRDPGTPDGDLAAQVLATIGAGGYFFRPLAAQLGVGDAELTRVLWDLAWAGLVTNDTLAPLRAWLGTSRSSMRRTSASPRGRLGRASLSRYRYGSVGGPSAPEVAGRWSALVPPAIPAAERALGTAELLLDRYGVLTRGSVAAEEVSGGFSAIYPALAASEDAGRIRRGYFVEGLGAAQFGSVGAVDRLRAGARALDELPEQPETLVLAAADPANPYGAALPWPARGEGGHLPGRKAGALVVLVDGELVLYVERGGRTLLSWSGDPARLRRAATGLAEAVHRGVLGRLTVAKVDGESVLGTQAPLATALAESGFRLTPSGLRLRHV